MHTHMLCCLQLCFYLRKFQSCFTCTADYLSKRKAGPQQIIPGEVKVKKSCASVPLIPHLLCVLMASQT